MVDAYCRLITKNDLKMLMQWRMRQDITKFLNTDPVLTMEKQLEWYKNITKNGVYYNWVIEHTNKKVGYIHVFDIENESCEWGYYIAEKQGITLPFVINLELSLYDFLFQNTDVTSIRACTFAKNASVVKIHELCGCEHTHTTERAVEKNGEYYDVVTQTKYKKDWKVQSSPIQFEKLQ